VIAGDTGKALIYIDEIIRRGKDPRQIMKDWLKHMRDLMIVKYVGRAERIVGSSGENISRLRAQAELTDAAFIEKSIRLISEYINLGRYSERPRILLETAAVRLASADDIADAPAKRPLRPAVKRDAASARPADTPVRAQAKADEKPAADALADMIASVQREQPGSPEEMWDRIVRAVAAGDRTFMSLVGRYSTGVEFDAGRLQVIVSPGKLRLAEDKSAEIAQAAKSIYGSDVYVSMKAGVISKSGAAEGSAGISEEETAKIINDDINKNEVIGDIVDLFGIQPVMED
jgi:DNA polymerase III gamma/tau subunit